MEQVLSFCGLFIRPLEKERSPNGSLARQRLVRSTKSILIVLSLFSFANQSAFSQEMGGWGDYYISYIREVGNVLHLSDFQLGSNETIKDVEGHGISVGRIFENEGVSFFLISAGYSQTKYEGTVEDGVSINFEPQSGSGYEVLSTSNNILYDVNLKFSNPFISLSYTNWYITRYSLENLYLLPSTYGIGLIFQKAEGDVVIRGADNITIASASYESGTQRFAYMGWNFNIDFLYMSLVIRYVTSPVLKIDDCNEIAVGQTACSRIEAATGNRNVSPQLFTGGVFEVGVLF